MTQTRRDKQAPGPVVYLEYTTFWNYFKSFDVLLKEIQNYLRPESRDLWWHTETGSQVAIEN